ncbi:MAG: cysteine desulfurase [Clostridia bacterium]|nr:cysteine desulfurase [Clostridia bacterium]
MQTVEKLIYLDHAATTPLCKEALEAMTPYFCECFGNADSPHKIGRKAMVAVDSARDKIAAIIGANPKEIYFTSGGTEADNWALVGGALAQKGKRVIISAIEHHAVLAAADKLRGMGVQVDVLPVNQGGRVELNALKEMLDTDVGLVCVMTANNETGVLQPVQEIASLCKENGVLFFTDAVQAMPYLDVNVKEWGVDMLSFSAHKFYGPKGIGALYIKSGVKIEKFVCGGEQERGMRGGTVNVPSVVGFAAALEKTAKERKEREKHLQNVRAAFLQELSGLEGVSINGDEGLPAVLNLRLDGVENDSLLYAMDLQGVAMAAGSACASASVKPSHVLTAMGLSEMQAKNSVRISFGKDNTEEDARKAARLLKAEVEKQRTL